MSINLVSLKVVKERAIKYQKRQISGPKDLSELGFKLLSQADREVFMVVCLNSKNNINAVHIVSVGSLTAAIVHPREVYKLAIMTNSAAIALLHNHPSGDIQPSREDIEITQRLIDAGKLLNIHIIDHMVIGDGEFYSFLENNVCNF